MSDKQREEQLKGTNFGMETDHGSELRERLSGGVSLVHGRVEMRALLDGGVGQYGEVVGTEALGSKLDEALPELLRQPCYLWNMIVGEATLVDFERRENNDRFYVSLGNARAT